MLPRGLKEDGGGRGGTRAESECPVAVEGRREGISCSFDERS